MNKIPFVFIGLGLMMAGCSHDEPLPDPAIAACPEKVVRVAQANELFFEQKVKVGATRASKLDDLDGLKRVATLVKDGAPSMEVRFYQTGIPRCPWVMAKDSLTPAVIKDGVIVAYGVDSVHDMTSKGWRLKEAAWPWQSYEFGYLPYK